MEKLQLSPPWVTFYRELEMLLKQDKEIFTTFDQEEMVIKVYVDNAQKAEALDRLLVKSKVFGNITVNVNVIPSNKVSCVRSGSIYDEAFTFNPVYRYSCESSLPVSNRMFYVVWSREVAQFFNDNLADVNRNQTMLYEDIARDVLVSESGVYHCTDGAH